MRIDSVETLEEQLRQELHSQATTLQVPDDIDQRVRASMQDFIRGGAFASTSASSRRKTTPFRKKSTAIAAAAAIVLLPTAAFAYSNLADDLFGNFGQFKKAFSYATKEIYLEVGTKLSGAKSKLTSDEYDRFMALNKQYFAFQKQYAEPSGHIDGDKLTSAQHAQLFQILTNMEPLDDKLNGGMNKQQVLSAQEFHDYIEAEITFDTVMAKIDWEKRGIPDPNTLPPDLRQRFTDAQKVLDNYGRQAAKLPDDWWTQKAKTELGAEFPAFEDVLVKETDLRRQYGDEYMQIDYDKVSADVKSQMKALIEQDGTYRDKMYHKALIRDLLSPQAYDEYIDAEMVLETARSKSQQQILDESKLDAAALPADFRDRFEQARATVNQVLEMQKNKSAQVSAK